MKKHLLPFLLALLAANAGFGRQLIDLDHWVGRLHNNPSDTTAWTALRTWFDTTSQSPELLNAHLERLIPTVQAGNPRLLAELSRQKGIVHMDLGEYARSSEWLVQAIRLYESLADAAGIANTRVNLGALNYHLSQFSEAIAYWEQAAAHFTRRGPAARLALVYSNIGSAFSETNRLDSAEWYHRQALQISERHNDLKSMSRAWNNLGVTFEYAERYDEALRCYRQARALCEKIRDQAGIVRAILNAATILNYQQQYDEALAANREAVALLKGCREKTLFRLAYLNLADIYSQTGRYREAFESLNQYQLYKDSIINEDNTRYVQNLQVLYETEKKEREIAQLNRESETQSLRLERQRLLTGGLLLTALLLSALVWLVLHHQRRTDRLLHNILPVAVAAELRATGKVQPKRHESVTVLFADLVGFTELGHSLSPEALVSLIDRYYRAFDEIIAQAGLEKIKTIGDSYMCAAGLPAPNPQHALLLFQAARNMLCWVEQDAAAGGYAHLQLRIGMHSGPVVAGVAGKTKYAYDIWGDTVNTAARMEQYGLPGRINLSEATRALLGDSVAAEAREPVDVKGLGLTSMYLAG